VGVVIRVSRIRFEMPRGRLPADFVEHCELSLESCMELELERVAGLGSKHETSYAHSCAPYFLLLVPIALNTSNAFTRRTENTLSSKCCFPHMYSFDNAPSSSDKSIFTRKIMELPNRYSNVPYNSIGRHIVEETNKET
jgi:hypothetical protein